MRGGFATFTDKDAADKAKAQLDGLSGVNLLLKLKEVLGDKDAPTSKSDPEELKSLFAKALPDYDETRFYVSHMKKVVDWYNEIKERASFDFIDPDEEKEAEGEAEA